MLDTFKDVIDSLSDKIKDIRQYQAEYKKLSKEIAALEKKGIVNAAPSWRSKKYFYLVHPMVKGERKKEYIGSDAAKIKEAEQKIENYKLWVKCKDRQKEIVKEIIEFDERLNPKYLSW